MVEEEKKNNKENLKQKIYKLNEVNIHSSLRIVSMIPGDRKVAGCLFL
jgi:hypothetical protein